MLTPVESLVDRWIGRHRSSAASPQAAATAHPVALVTGGSRGLGQALAFELARLGHRVAIVARDPKALAAVAREIEAAHGRPVAAIPLDLTEFAAVDRLDRALADLGCHVDILVNNAAIGLGGPFHQQTPAEVGALCDLNMRVPAQLMRHYLPGMLARGRGGIINMASLGAYVPGPHQAAYYASKSFVVSLTEAVRHEVAGQGVRVCVASPGPVATTFHASMGAEDAYYLKAFRPALPQAVARSVMRGYRLGHTLIYPGLLTHLEAIVLNALPHLASVPMMGWLLDRRRRP
jgi:hypothetical protein